jgi:photosystem II stability/assembly factor-like uncharacterized protein
MKIISIMFLVTLFVASPAYSQNTPQPETIFGTNPTNSFPVLGFADYNGLIIGLGHFSPAIYSDDDGRTWKSNPPGLPQNLQPTFHARNLAYEGDIVVLTSQARHIQLSTDGGQTWQAVNTGAANNNNFIKAEILNGNIFLQVGSPPGYYVSRDTAATWESLQVIPQSATRSVVMHRDTLFASFFHNASNASRAQFSVDGGRTWRATTTGLTAAQSNGAVLHTIADRLFLLPLTGNLQREWNGTAFMPTEFFPAAGGQVQRYAGRIWYQVADAIWFFDEDTSEWVEDAELRAGLADPYPSASGFFRSAVYLAEDFRLISYAKNLSPSFSDGTRLVRVETETPRFAGGLFPGITPAVYTADARGVYIASGTWDRFYAGADGLWQLPTPVLATSVGSITDVATGNAGVLAATSSGNLLLFDAQFGGEPETVLEGVGANVLLSASGDNVIAVGSNAIWYSSDAGRSFTQAEALQENTRLARAQFYDDGILAGNVFSSDGGRNWNGLFTLPGNPVIASSYRIRDTYIAEAAGVLYFWAGSGSPVRVDSPVGAVSGLIANEKYAIYRASGGIYYSANFGQTAELYASAPGGPMVLHDGFLYFSNETMLQRLNFSGAGSGFAMETLEAGSIVAADSSALGARIVARGYLDSPELAVDVTFEWREVFVNDPRSGVSQVTAFPATATAQNVEITVSGLPSNTFLEYRMVGQSGDVRVNGSWLRLRTPNYQFWSDITPVDCGTCRFYDGMFTPTGRLLLGGSAGVYISDDQARTWELMPGSPGSVTSFTRARGDTLVAGTIGGGVYWSADDGATWAQFQNTGLPGGLGGPLSLRRMTYSEPQHTLISIYGDRLPATNNAVLLVLSRDMGRTWSVITDTVGLRNRLPLALASDAEGRFYLGTNSQATPDDEPNDPVLRRSSDGGRTWEPLMRRDGTVTQVPRISSVEELIVEDGVVYAMTTNGIYSSPVTDTEYEPARPGGTVGGSRNMILLSENNYLLSTGYRSSDAFNFSEGITLLRADGVTQSVSSGYPITRSRINRLVRLSDSSALGLSNRGVFCFMCDGESQSVSVPFVREVDGPEVEIPMQVYLAQNYPNPFNPTTVIPFGLSEAGVVRLEVYNVLGQRVAVLLAGEQLAAGQHQVRFDARGLASGVYLARLQAGGVAVTRQMLLMR